MDPEIRLDHADLDRVQDLAQLELESGEREQLLVDLRRILRFAAEMGELPEDVSPDETPPARLREGDAPSKHVQKRTHEAPDWREGWFVVPDGRGGP